MSEDPNNPKVLRGIGPDVSESVYKRRFCSLKGFIEQLDPNQVKSSEELFEILRVHGNELAVVIRHQDSYEKKSGQHEKVNWESYTPTIKQGNVAVDWFTDYGFVRIALAGPKGFNENGRPLGGFELIVPDGTGKDKWLDHSFQLTILDNQGNFMIDSVNVKKMSLDDVTLFTEKYKAGVSAVIDFVEKNENN